MSVFAAIYANPPDKNEPIPISNKPATIFGATLPFHHLFYIDPKNFVTLFKFIYVQNASYYTCAGLVKISLLCQYLRLFKKGLLRKMCIILMVLTSLWACFWFIQGWFPCFPVSGFWNRTQTPAPKCWGTGFANVEDALAAFLGFAASNMVLDTIIFLIPIALYIKPGLDSRQVLALVSLFSLGSIVLLMSILRLWTAMRHNKFSINAVDFTWWYPLTMILASLEIDFAIICASIPIFWPVIISALPQIFVTQEVRVTHHRRIQDDSNMEYEMSRSYSMKSNGSQEKLTEIQVPTKTDYSDQLIVGHVTGKIEQTTEVVSGKQQKKRNR
ncbi:hypothetical protein N0V90_003507 [Kalmusia sp. IMI 367209]|nr:hypothetical protein N0V90_003507 [Kalmusia sp. IMI 367209]